MEIKKISINNFRPYYGLNEIDTSVNPEQNVIIIGGKNGQGKTSLLVALVWCMYGERISRLDDTFHREVRGNYQKFLSNALNRIAADQGREEFSISIDFSNVDIADILLPDGSQGYNVTLLRSYNTQTGKEIFKIFINGQETELVSDDQDKANFVDDYLIPAEAAKFVFFDAEKISDIAELNIKEQGKIMNLALGNILGLSKYEETIESLDLYVKELKIKKQSQTNISSQIDSYKKTIEMNKENIEKTIIANEEIDDNLKIIERNINDYQQFLIKNGGKSLIQNDIETLENEKNRIEKELSSLGERLKSVSETIPLAISAGKIQELAECLRLEKEISNKQASNKEIKAKSEEFIDALFEQPDFPPNGDIKTLQKAFYIEKAQTLFSQIFSYVETNEEIPFLHDLSQNHLDYIENTLNKIKNGDEQFNHIYSDYIKIKNQLDDKKAQLNKAKSKIEDEIFSDYRDKLEESKKEQANLNQRKGANENKINSYNIEIETAQKMLNSTLSKVTVSQQEKEIIDDVNNHILALSEFVEMEKKLKCNSLSISIFHNMKSLMHKKDLIDEVKVEILPNKGGLEVTLLKDSHEVPKDLLSAGEKQIYISCLIKAILNEATTDFPIFIDTPLGRLDKSHKDSFVHSYYPSLGSQVIILSTDEEITNSRYEKISKHVAQKYILSNQNNITHILPGYFES